MIIKYLIAFFVLFTHAVFGQHWQISALPPMPEKVSNHAVCEGMVNDTPFVYSFAGIDESKLFSGIHLKSYRLNTITNEWTTLPSLPDTLGKIACSANRIGNIIYIVGGYHVLANGNEVSSNKVHRFNILTNQFMADAAHTLFPVDDQVQCVYKDSLLFVVTGWSNSTNLAAVQVYNPLLNTWSAATSIPNNNTYKSFGASGTIVGDTLYYLGGASSASGFEAQNVLRKGYINPLNPLQIAWTFVSPAIKTYRSAAVTLNNTPFWLGGSATTYNYNGIAYNGSGGVEPANRSLLYHNGVWNIDSTNNLPMDLRGVAKLSDSVIVLGGGMEANQQVSNKVYRLSKRVFRTALDAVSKDKEAIAIYPNPAKDVITIASPYTITRIRLLNQLGEEVLVCNPSNQLSVAGLNAGLYVVEFMFNDVTTTKKIIITR